MRTILAMGQSNARGNFAGGAFSMHANVIAWNNQNHRDDLEFLGDAWIAPSLLHPPLGPGNNMMAWAASLIAEITDEPVRLILAARGGMSIGNGWIDEAGNPQLQYERTLAILEAAEVSYVDDLLWHQGESDVTSGNAATWPTKFGNLLMRLENDGVITSATPVVIGELGPGAAALNPIMAIMSGNDPRISIARLANLPTLDSIHFSPDIIPLCGRRYVEALARLDATVADILPVGDCE